MIAVEHEGHDVATESETEASRRTMLWPSLRLRDLPPPHIAST
jgi:hypothetical protein